MPSSGATKLKGFARASRFHLEDRTNQKRTGLTPSLLNRFYEPLVLLYTLDPVQDERFKNDISQCDNIADLPRFERRRETLKNLCIICDYTKGGDTVTAMIQAKLPEGSMFWLASNQDPSKKIAPFLAELFKDIVIWCDSKSTGDAVMAVFNKAMTFDKRKMKEYLRFLQPPLDKCLDYLQGREDMESQGTLKLLSTFKKYVDKKLDLFELCRHAYMERKSLYLRGSLFKDEDNSPFRAEQNSISSSFATVKHYIGRLACTMRAAKCLVEAQKRDAFFSNNPTIRCCKHVEIGEAPNYKHNLTLEAIAGRMFHRDDKERQADFTDAIVSMDEQFSRGKEEDGILYRVHKQYQDPTFKPRIHAELRLLEELYADGKVQLPDGDRFIACSKPACFCCYQYLKFHPYKPELPACHNKIYLNWAPPEFGGSSERQGQRQLDVMNSLISELRERLIAQVARQVGPRTRRPDTTTGITTTDRDAWRSTHTWSVRSWDGEGMASSRQSRSPSPVGSAMAILEPRNSASTDSTNGPTLSSQTESRTSTSTSLNELHSDEKAGSRPEIKTQACAPEKPQAIPTEERIKSSSATSQCKPSCDDLEDSDDSDGGVLVLR